MTNNLFQSYLIEPKAPLIVRSGRPFSESAGTDPARFPPPSTIAGALRAAYARSNQLPFSTDLYKQSILGPLAAKLDLEGRVITLLVPKPADASYFEKDNTKLVIASMPKQLNKGEGCDLPKGLMPMQLVTEGVVGKPCSGPTWWSWDDFAAWRRGKSKLAFSEVSSNGWTPPKDDIRTHIAIKPSSLTTEAGILFQTAGLNMWDCEQKNLEHGSKFPEHAIGLIACIDGNITSNSVVLGGEQRLSAITTFENQWPAIPVSLCDDIASAKGLSLSLLTPALFEKGWLPGWIDETTMEGRPPDCEKLTLKLQSAAVGSWQPQSGWDLDTQKPRAARKMVPAGASFWFEVKNFHAEDVKKLWMQTISDSIQDRRDGFGLALPSPYTPPTTT